jgi:hypothetical protein
MEREGVNLSAYFDRNSRGDRDRLTKVGKPIDVQRLVEELDPDDVGDLDKLLGEKGEYVDRLVHVLGRVEQAGDAVRGASVALAVLRAGS